MKRPNAGGSIRNATNRGAAEARRASRRFVTAVVAMSVVMWPAAAHAQERFAVIISGASGGEVYAAHHMKWRNELAAALKTAFRFPDSNVAILTEEDEGTSRSDAANVQRLLGDLRRRVDREDVVLVVLLGHGTFDGANAKFNLVGPDLTAQQWKDLLSALPARTVLVNTTASSFPFLEELSQRGRVVITATDSVAQRFATVFPEYFVQVLREGASDTDKNGRVSVWEAFAAASAAVKQHYEQRGQLSTERPLLDDDGDRVGREADAPGEDGASARVIYLDAPAGAVTGDEILVALEKQRSTIEAQVEELKTRKTTMPEDEYLAELERLLLQLARIAQQIRQRS